MPLSPKRKAELIEWQEGRVKVAVENVDKPFYYVNGFTYGCFGVRLGNTKEEGWAVVANLCGYRLAVTPRIEDAKLIAETLWRECRDAFSQESPEEIKKRLPPWVEPWVKYCSKTVKKFTPCEPFKAKYSTKGVSK